MSTKRGRTERLLTGGLDKIALVDHGGADFILTAPLDIRQRMTRAEWLEAMRSVRTRATQLQVAKVAAFDELMKAIGEKFDRVSKELYFAGQDLVDSKRGWWGAED